MKLSTHNQSNQNLKSDKRFEALIKKEMVEHQAIISSHHKEMQELRDTLKLSMERFDSLFWLARKELDEFKAETSLTIASAREKLSASETLIASQKETIEDLHKQLLAFQVGYTRKEEVQTVKSCMDERLNCATQQHLSDLGLVQREAKNLIQAVRDDLVKLSVDVGMKITNLSETVESKYDLMRMDKEGILHELKVYEKAVFIIEKKIENIYTLIERIKACPRQE